jgi:hypothetical protein
MLVTATADNDHISLHNFLLKIHGHTRILMTNTLVQCDSTNKDLLKQSFSSLLPCTQSVTLIETFDVVVVCCKASNFATNLYTGLPALYVIQQPMTTGKQNGIHYLLL